MFRELKRKNKQITDTECREFLAKEPRGVLSVIGDDLYPYAMPMNHFYNFEDGCIYFHCGNGAGHRSDSLSKNNKVCFCVYDLGTRDEGDWALNIKSVIVFGKIDIIDDRRVVEDISRKLSLKFTQDASYIENEIKAHAARTLILRLTPEHICGKLVRES